MPRRLLTILVDLLLLAAAAVALLTGLFAYQLDLNQFVVHRWAGYALAVLVAIHVGMHGRSCVVRSTRTRQATPPAEASGDTTVVAGGRAARQGVALSRRTALAALVTGAVGAVGGWFVKGEVSPNPYPGGDVGLFYHRESSLGGLRTLVGGLVRWGSRPARYKQAGGAVVALPPVVAPPSLSVAQALAQRRSLRRYADRTMTATDLAWLVHAATAITGADGRRTAPSAGALYPIETYVAARQVQGVPPGLYHVDVRAQRLEQVRRGSVADDLMAAALGQDFVRRAPAVLVLTGLFQRTRWKYHERHYRYVCWEGGHVAQNVYLAAEAAGMGACMVGAFFDGRLNDLLRVDGRHEAALGLVAVGPR